MRWACESSKISKIAWRQNIKDLLYKGVVTRPLKLESQCIDSNCRVEKMSRRCKKRIKCCWIFRSCHGRLGNLPSLPLYSSINTHIFSDSKSLTYWLLQPTPHSRDFHFLDERLQSERKGIGPHSSLSQFVAISFFFLPNKWCLNFTL